MKMTYTQAIGEEFPDIQVSCIGDGTVYEDLVLESGPALPTKQELDDWIAVQAQTSKWLEIQAERDKRKSMGTKVGSKWYHSDDFSRIQQLGLVMMGANMPAGIQWKTMDLTFVTMTPTLALQIFQAVAVADMVIFGVAEAKRIAMLSIPDPDVYDVQAGWPEQFIPPL
jgi:hypothetical protein